MLEVAPHSGLPYPPDSEFRDLYYKNVVVRPRRWSYRVTYEIRGDAVWVLLVGSPWRTFARGDL